MRATRISGDQTVAKFTREYLSGLGVYDYRHRHYHPGLGRFIQTDPLGLQIEGTKLSAQQAALYPAGSAPATFSSSELNLYRYCHNDPINKSDPMGLLAPEILYDDSNKKAMVETDLKALRQIPAFDREMNKMDKNDKYNAIKDAESGDNRTTQRSPNGLKTNNTVRNYGVRDFLRDLKGLFSRSGSAGTGATTFYSPTNRQTVSGRDRAPIFGLANEMGEMFNANNGTWGQGGFSGNDNRSIWFENQAREAFGAEARPYH